MVLCNVPPLYLVGATHIINTVADTLITTNRIPLSRELMEIYDGIYLECVKIIACGGGVGIKLNVK